MRELTVSEWAAWYLSQSREIKAEINLCLRKMQALGVPAFEACHIVYDVVEGAKSKARADVFGSVN